jgi:ectoine hydroxylase-related dioxygenase (phytanoyl-CoA dioxygenase family)
MPLNATLTRSSVRLLEEADGSFLRDGYCLLRDLVPKELLAAARERVCVMMEEQPDWAVQWQILDPSRATNGKGEPLPIGIQGPASREAVFDRVARHPSLEAVASSLLGGPVTMATDQLIVKHGFIHEEQGGASFYHQDSFYWHLEPGTGLNAWLPLDDVGPNNIGLVIKPGSHLDWQLLPHEKYTDQPKWGHMKGGTFESFDRLRIPAATIDFSDVR